MPFLNQRQIRSSWHLILSTHDSLKSTTDGVQSAEVRIWMEQAFGRQLNIREQLAEALLKSPNPFDQKRCLPKVEIALLACTLLVLLMLFFSFNPIWTF
ncbi:MAG: hypothetical protein WAM39_22650 [Bryobacteraceae bacterium]